LPISCRSEIPYVFEKLASESPVIIDFGQNMAGRLKISLPLPSIEQCQRRIDAGYPETELVVLLRHSELLHSNGSLNTVTLGATLLFAARPLFHLFHVFYFETPHSSNFLILFASNLLSRFQALLPPLTRFSFRLATNSCVLKQT
jgi:hypothetical protein